MWPLTRIFVNKLKNDFARSNFGTIIGQTLMQLGDDLICYQYSNAKYIFALKQLSVSNQNYQEFSLEKVWKASVVQNKECEPVENCEIDHVLLIISSGIFVVCLFALFAAHSMFSEKNDNII